MIAARLTMRAALERNQTSANDDWGNAAAPDYQPHADLPCFVWSKSSREKVDGTQDTLIEDTRGMFALNADLKADDEIAAITNRKGDVLLPGRFKVDGPPAHKHTHIEVNLKRIG